MSKTWEDLRSLVHEDIKKGIDSFNFPFMTPVQAGVIPHLLNKKDVVAEAVTGSGKTLAFLIPLLEILTKRNKERKWKKNEIGALIVSPTRELALQTKQVLGQLLKHVSGLTHLLFVGGSPIEYDLDTFKSKGGNIIICTPGRFEDLLLRKGDLNLVSSLKSLEILILDEADILLDNGFQNTIDTILSFLPKQRQTGLFSATQTKHLQDLIRAGLRNPVLVSVSSKAEHNTPESLNNYYVVVKDNNKLVTLLSFIGNRDIQKVIVFLPTCAVVDYWSQVFPHICDFKVPVFAIHGKMKEKRKKIFEKFKKSDKGILLCTDVMARGVDIPEVDWVLQWDPPTNASAYVHRVGRTARQGKRGSSLILLLETEEAYVHFIEKNQRVKLEKLDVAYNNNKSKADSIRNILNKLQMQDRELMDKATTAFVSHIRAYSKHECSLLLRVKDLPLGSIASTYGLLKLPKMPELKNAKVTDFETACNVDLNSICYKNPNKESQRIEKLKTYEETGVWPRRGGNNATKKSSESWSITKQKKIHKKEKRLKRRLSKLGSALNGDEQSKHETKKARLAEDLEL